MNESLSQISFTNSRSQALLHARGVECSGRFQSPGRKQCRMVFLSIICSKRCFVEKIKMHQNFINFVLDNDIISLELKKKLVLFSIQAAQNGDNTGSLILQFYYDMVNHLL